jgi:CcmD family protein
MSDLVYLYAAYTIVWAGVFLYCLYLALQLRGIEKEMSALKEVVDARGK